jgi:hypothetical protein
MVNAAKPGKKKKRSPLRKYCTEYAHDDGHEDIPDAVEDSVATKPGWQGVPVDETDRYRGNDRREHAPKDRHGDICGEHDWNGWRPDDGEAANREDDRTGDEQSPLSPHFVDPSADRGVQHDASQAAHGENSADRRLAPTRISEEVDVHVSAEPARTSARRKLTQSRAPSRMRVTA